MHAMVIQKRRIRKLPNYFRGIEESQQVTIGLPITDENLRTLQSIGFSSLLDGETVLPRVVGPITRFNADGKEKIRRDLEKETLYRAQEWKRQEWRGKDDTEEITDWVDIPYKRYPREHIPAPSIELTCVTNSHGQKLVIAPALAYTEDSDLLLHTVNLFLELFREAHVLGEDRLPVSLPTVQRLSWHILPPGEMPWEQLKTELATVINQTRQSQRKFLELRLEALAKYAPTFTAVGTAGFAGYVIFGFPKKGLYVLECGYYGNATYVLKENWQALSQLTKAELIHGDLHERRIVHLTNWPEEIRLLLQ